MFLLLLWLQRYKKSFVPWLKQKNLTNFLRGRALIHILLMFQPCHPCAGLSDGGDLWLRRVSQVCRRGSAGLHRLLNILRPYGAGSRRNGTKAVAETPCGASATDDSGLCEPKCSKEAVRFQPVFPFWGEAVQQKQQTGHSYK